MSHKGRRYRDPEDLTDSETEVHPNIEARGFHHFMREEKRHRLEELRSRKNLTPEEEKEMADLEYKFLPVADEVTDQSSYSMPKKEEVTEIDYSNELMSMLNNENIDSFLEILDTHEFNLEHLEEYILINESEAIKSGDDSLGYALCRLGLLVKWAMLYGRQYIAKLGKMGEEQMRTVCEAHYAASKEAIINLKKTEEDCN